MHPLVHGRVSRAHVAYLNVKDMDTVYDTKVDDLEVQKWDDPSGVIRIAGRIVTRTIQCDVWEYPGAPAVEGVGRSRGGGTESPVYDGGTGAAQYDGGDAHHPGRRAAALDQRHQRRDCLNLSFGFRTAILFRRIRGLVSASV